jgi:hypothetical protein
MAYLNFTELQGTPIAAPADVLTGDVSIADIMAPESRTAGFTGLEWSVVAIAQKDRLSSLGTPGRLSVALGSIFGSQGGSARLADPRLEALRRLSVLAWHHGYSVPRHEIRAFHQAGYTPEQYEMLLDSISRGRSALNQGRRTR